MLTVHLLVQSYHNSLKIKHRCKTNWMSAAAEWLCCLKQSLSLACQVVQPVMKGWISECRKTEQNQEKVSEWNEHCAGSGYSVIQLPTALQMRLNM